MDLELKITKVFSDVETQVSIIVIIIVISSTSRWIMKILSASCTYQVGICSFKFNNGNTKTMCEICSKLTITTLERRHQRRSGAINFEQISHIAVICFPY